VRAMTDGAGSCAPVLTALNALAADHRASGALLAGIECWLDGAAAQGIPPEAWTQSSEMDQIMPRLLVLRALHGMGLLERAGGRYRLAAALCEGPGAVSGALLRDLLCLRSENRVWLRMADILRGRARAPDGYRRELLDGRIADRPGIRRMNRHLADPVVTVLAAILGSAPRVLDIGGGDGLYAGILLDRGIAAQVDIVDLESGFALCDADPAHLAGGRLRPIVGDARDPLPAGGYDLVMVNELLELFPAPEKRMILARAVAALRPGGTILVSKFTLDASAISPPGAALFSMRMQLKAESHLETDCDVADMLAALGCWDVHFAGAGGIKTIITARIPGGPAASSPDRKERPMTSQHQASEDQAAQSQAPQWQAGLWGQLVSAATSFRAGAILFAAADLRLFDHVAPEGSDAQAVADALEMPFAGVRVLLNALAAIGLLALEEERYFLHPDLRALLASGPDCILEALLQYRDENEAWLGLAARLRDDAESGAGAPPDGAEIVAEPQLPAYLSSVSLANQPSARLLVAALAESADPVERALDLGGGDGDYARLLLEIFPQARVTLLDRPQVIDRARSVLADRVAEGRLQLLAGDALDFALPDPQDVVLVSDLLHYFSRAGKRAILSNAARALRPGGRLAIGKFTLDAGGSQPVSAALLSLKLALKRRGAYLESDEEAADLLREIGLADVAITPLDALKSSVTGRRPPEAAPVRRSAIAAGAAA